MVQTLAAAMSWFSSFQLELQLERAEPAHRRRQRLDHQTLWPGPRRRLLADPGDVDGLLPGVRAIMFDGPDVGGGDELVQLFPAGADKTAFAARRFIAAGFCRILHDAIPCQHRVGVARCRTLSQREKCQA